MKTISKHILALVAMFVLAPSASADDTAGLVTNKTVKDKGNGNYALTLETFATGCQLPIGLNASTPTAFALIVDKSSNMSDGDAEMLFAQKSDDVSYTDWWNNEVLKVLNPYHGGDRGTYYFYAKYGAVKNSKYVMFYEDNQWKFMHNTLYHDGAKKTFSKSNLEDLDIHKIFIKKINAEKIAAKNFVDMIWNNEVSTGVLHHVALITFSNGSEIRYGMQPLVESHYKNIMKEIDGLVANGTQVDTDWGIANAAKTLHDTALMNRVAVLMTAGSPSSDGLKFNWQTANSAIYAASILKMHLNTKFYTLGVWDCRDTADKDIFFLNWTSSNFPYAVAPQTSFYDDAIWKNAADLHTYFSTDCAVVPGQQMSSAYFNANNTTMGQVTSFFENIAKTEVTGGCDVRLGTTTEVRDYVASDFKLPAGITAGDIVIKKVKCVSASPYTWDEANAQLITQSSTGVHATVDATNNMVSVTGFDYTSDDNWVGTHYVDNGTNAIYESFYGYKLVLEIPIEPKDTYTGGVSRPTNNDSDTGVYFLDHKLKGYPVPTVDLPVKVTIASKGLELGDNAAYNVRFTGVRDGTDSSIRFQGPYSTTVVASGKGATETVSQTLLLYPGNYAVSSANDCSKKYTLTVNSDGSYTIKENATISYVYQQLANPDPAPEAIARNVFSRKTTKVSYKVTK